MISKKKPFFPIFEDLMHFLKKYDRWMESNICYEDLLRFSGSVVVYDKNDRQTLVFVNLSKWVSFAEV